MTGRKRLRLPLMATLSVGVIVLVLATALTIHGTWYRVTRGASQDLATQINRQIADAIHKELRNVIDNAEAAREALRTIFFQDVIETTDEAKREFVFLAALQSQPSLSWVAFGWPSGDFFGAQKLGARGIGMVEVRPEGDDRSRQRRVDTYRAEPGDIIFLERRFTPSTFMSTEQPWYRLAVAGNGPIWVSASDFPTRQRPAIANAAPLLMADGTFVGVLMVAIELDRISSYLADLRVAKSGTVFILDSDGRVIAFPDSSAAGDEGDRPPLPMIDAMAAPHVTVAARALGLGDRQRRPAVQREAMLRWDDGNDYLVSTTPLGFEDWSVVTVIPERDFLEEIDRVTQLLLIAVAVLALVAAGAAVAATNRLITRPLLRIVGQLRFVEQFRLDRVATVPSPLKEIDDLGSGLVQMSRGLSSFQKFLPTELVRTLVSEGIEARPGGHQRELTLMFTDLAGFTRLSETLGDRIVPILADYLGRMSRLIHDGGGTIDKFIGDAVMAFWGAPREDPQHALHACRTALACQRMMGDLAHHTAAHGQPPLMMRIGLNTGTVLVGNIGSEERLNYTAIGDPVNLASRLEALNKRYGTLITIGETTRREAGEAIVVRRLDKVAVYGRQAGEWIYELVGLAGESGDRNWIGAFEQGLDRYAARDWTSAMASFERAIALRGDDPPSLLFIERCRRFQAQPPGPDWDMVERFEEK